MSLFAVARDILKYVGLGVLESLFAPFYSFCWRVLFLVGLQTFLYLRGMEDNVKQSLCLDISNHVVQINKTS